MTCSILRSWHDPEVVELAATCGVPTHAKAVRTVAQHRAGEHRAIGGAGARQVPAIPIWLSPTVSADPQPAVRGFARASSSYAIATRGHFVPVHVPTGELDAVESRGLRVVVLKGVDHAPDGGISAHAEYATIVRIAGAPLPANLRESSEEYDAPPIELVHSGDRWIARPLSPPPLGWHGPSEAFVRDTSGRLRKRLGVDAIPLHDRPHRAIAYPIAPVAGLTR